MSTENKNSNSLEKNWKLVNFCEFDKYAIKSYCAIHNVDESLNLGDITKVDETKLGDFDMMTWGFPCTDISVAGKQKGFIDENGNKTRSGMYYEGIRILRYKKPKFSLIENVKNLTSKKFKQEFDMVLKDLNDAGYNSYYKVLNAKDYGIPQNRERVFILSIRKDLDNGKFEFPEPFDNGTRLKDILEDEVDEKFYISNDKVQKLLINLNNQGLNDNKNSKSVDNNAVKQIGNISNCEGNWKNPQVGRIYSPNGCSPTLNTCNGGGHEPKIITAIVNSCNNPRKIEIANCLTTRDRGISNRKQEGTAVLECIGNINPSGKGMNGNVFDENGLAPTLTTNKGEGNKIAIRQATKKGHIECKLGGVADLSYPESKTRRGRVQSGGQICPTITATETGVCRIESFLRIRKLTPKECFRLQGFSDENFEAAEKMVSNSQLYKQAGNSIAVDVLYYILIELYKAMPYLFDDLRLSSFFSGIGAFEIALNRLYEGINSGNFTKSQVD